MLLGQIDWCGSANMLCVQDRLFHRLRGRYSRVDEHLLKEAIDDSLMHHQRCPESFDACRGPLVYYLELWTRHYLDKRFQKERRHRLHEKAVGVSGKKFEIIVSGVSSERGISIGIEESEQEAEEREETLQRQKAILDAVVSQLNRRDRDGVRLLRTGASRAKWVRYLRIEDLPREEQQRKIDAEKDRLRKLLKRRVRKMPGGGKPQSGVRIPEMSSDADGGRGSWPAHLRVPRYGRWMVRERTHCSVGCSLSSACCCS